jgi:hypothetical protein
MFQQYFIPYSINFLISMIRITIPNKKKLRGFSPQANYTDRAIAAGQRS